MIERQSPVSRGERVCFAAGDAGFNVVWQSIELYLLFFYIHGVGLSPGEAATIFLAGAIVDWIADPVIGVLADRNARRFALRHWVGFGGPLACLALVASFMQPSILPSSGFAVALIGHIVLRLAYSTGNIPYAALTARITADVTERTQLTGTRMQGAALGGILAAVAYALMPMDSERTGALFAPTASLLALLALPLFLLTARGVQERVEPPSTTINPLSQLGHLAGLLLQSPDLRRILATVLACGLSATIVAKSILFLFEAQAQLRLGFIAAIIPPLMLLLSAPPWVALSRRIGRVPTLRVAIAVNLAVALFIPLVFGNPAAMLLGVTLAVIAGHGMSIMFWALIPDAVTATEAIDDGAYAAQVYALAGIARKLAQALAPTLLAIGLAGNAMASVAWPYLAAALATAAIITFYPPRTPGA